MKQASQEIRSTVIAAYFSGSATRKQLSDIFGYHIETIGRWIRCSREGRLTPLARGHRVSVFSPAELEQLAVFIEKNPGATLAEIRDHFAKSCSLTAIQKTVKKIGYIFKKNAEGKRTKTRRRSQEP